MCPCLRNFQSGWGRKSIYKSRLESLGRFQEESSKRQVWFTYGQSSRMHLELTSVSLVRREVQAGVEGEEWNETGQPCCVRVCKTGEEIEQMMRAGAACVSGLEPIAHPPVSSSDAAQFSGP